jgi:anti-repressor protein
MSIIPESNLFRLILRSNMPGAVKFQDWVAEKVLPSIRKHGMYATPTRPSVPQSPPR